MRELLGEGNEMGGGIKHLFCTPIITYMLHAHIKPQDSDFEMAICRHRFSSFHHCCQ